jgi:hypothetical protein
MEAKKKRLKREVYEAIRNDIALRHVIGRELNIKPRSVYVSAWRKSSVFCIPFLVELLAKHLKKEVKEILEN